MKTTFVKLMLLLVVLAVALTGCNLIGIDPAKQAEEDIAKAQKKLATPVATYGDQKLTAGDIIGTFNSTYNQLYYMYYYYGMEMTEDEVNQIITSVMEDEVRSRVIAGHFDEYGLELTEEDNAACDEQAKSVSDEAYTSFLSEATGKTDAEKEAETRVNLEKMGYTYEKQLEGAVIDKKAEKVEQAVRDEVTEVTDEELKTAYDEAVAADQEKYTADRGAFESAMTEADTTVYYIPEGYRTVKHILLKPADDVMTAYTDAVSALEAANNDISSLQTELAELSVTDEAADEAVAEETEAPRTEEEINADLSIAQAQLPALEEAVKKAMRNCLANVQDRSTRIYERLSAGEDFEALIEEFGEDPGMQNEPTKTRGYYVSADSATWEKNFTNGAMMLEKVGDYSKIPVVSGSGVHIIKYMSDAPSGPVALEDVHDALYTTTLETKKTTHFDETVEKWLSENAATYDAAAFRDVVSKLAE